MSAVPLGSALRTCLAALGLGIGVAGCSKTEIVVNKPLAPAHENLMYIGTAYIHYISQYDKPPANADQLKPFLKEFGNPDDLLRSPRDGQPYVICWGVNILKPTPWANSTPVLAYEQTGDGNKRYVLTTMRSVVQLSRQDFQAASFPPGQVPPS
jgi:hypothetical protein